MCHPCLTCLPFELYSKRQVVRTVISGSDENHFTCGNSGHNKQRRCGPGIKPVGVFGQSLLREMAMTLSLQVTFRNMKHSTQVEDWIRAEAEKLETFYHRIIGRRLAVEVSHRHHKK